MAFNINTLKVKKINELHLQLNANQQQIQCLTSTINTKRLELTKIQDRVQISYT